MSSKFVENGSPDLGWFKWLKIDTPMLIRSEISGCSKRWWHFLGSQQHFVENRSNFDCAWFFHPTSIWLEPDTCLWQRLSDRSVKRARISYRKQFLRLPILWRKQSSNNNKECVASRNLSPPMLKQGFSEMLRVLSTSNSCWVVSLLILLRSFSWCKPIDNDSEMDFGSKLF